MAIVINHGRYPIARMRAQICMGNSLMPCDRTEHCSLAVVAPALLQGLSGEATDVWTDTRRPTDAGVRHLTNALASTDLIGSYRITRRADWWG